MEEGKEAAMKESEKEEARHWLAVLTRLHEQNEVAICEIANLRAESPPQDWDKAYSNANVRTLMSAIESIKELPKPKPKELRKLKERYTDLVAFCLKAGHLYLNAYYAGDSSRLQHSKMMFWASLVNPLLEEFSRDLDNLCGKLEFKKKSTS